MNITFYNLGTLKETKLDLRPLTVIIGPNNSNKTYVAYCVYRTWSIIQSSVERFILLTRYKQGAEELAKYQKENEPARRSNGNDSDDSGDHIANYMKKRESEQSGPTVDYNTINEIQNFIVSLEKLDKDEINSTFGTFEDFFHSMFKLELTNMLINS
jgi:hypothetical protein